jgi:hypothetical protein
MPGGSFGFTVPATGIAAAMRSAKLRVHVTRQNMIGLPRVIEFGWFATYPAEDGGVAYSLCSCGVVTLVVNALLVPVGLPSGLACVAALDVLCELTAH